MDIPTVLQELSPNAQVILLICFLVLIAGAAILLFVVALSSNATNNICSVISAITEFSRPRRYRRIDHREKLRFREPPTADELETEN